MLRVFRDNLALTAGVALPVLLMVLFLVAGRVAESTTPAPQHSVVFATSYDERWANQPWELSVEDGALVIHYDGDEVGEGMVPIKPALYVWDHESMFATVVDIDLDSVVDGQVQDPELARLNQRRLNADPESPDGYRFETSRGQGDGGLFREIIGLGRYRGSYVLRGGSRSIALKGADPFYQAQFLAWIED